MNKMDFIWKNGQPINWDDARTHVLTHGLHYGSAVFEGIRVYQTQTGPAVFQLQSHVDRFFYSADVMGMKMPFNREQISQAIIDIVRLNGLSQGYIRPLAYYGYETMKVVPSEDFPVDIIIACWPFADYFPVKSLDITISPYIRIHPKSTVTDAKISGHYVNSLLTGISIRGSHYHEAILLDVDGYVAEGSAENIFIVKNGKLITPPQGTILMGITRQTVIDIANDLNIVVEEKRFKPQDVCEADEVFFCGTAVEIMPIRSLDNHIITPEGIGVVTNEVKEIYNKIVHGKISKYHKVLTLIS